jgi:hypothetical protein
MPLRSPSAVAAAGILRVHPQRLPADARSYPDKPRGWLGRRSPTVLREQLGDGHLPWRAGLATVCRPHAIQNGFNPSRVMSCLCKPTSLRMWPG